MYTFNSRGIDPAAVFLKMFTKIAEICKHFVFYIEKRIKMW